MSQPLHPLPVPPAQPPGNGQGGSTPPGQQPPAVPGQQYQAGGGQFTGGQQPGQGQGGAQPPAPGQGGQLPAPSGDQGDPSQLGDPGLRALNAERQAAREARQQAAQLQQQLDAINRQNMSDVQRAQAEAADWQRRFNEVEVQRLRYDAAMRHNVAAENMVLLTGSTAEELEAQAARLAQLTGYQVPPAGGAMPPAPVQYPGGATPPPYPQYPYPPQPAPPVQPPTRPWAPNPGQQVGNAPAPPAATVDSGRDLYRQKHNKSTGGPSTA